MAALLFIEAASPSRSEPTGALERGEISKVFPPGARITRGNVIVAKGKRGGAVHSFPSE